MSYLYYMVYYVRFMKQTICLKFLVTFTDSSDVCLPSLWRSPQTIWDRTSAVTRVHLYGQAYTLVQVDGGVGPACWDIENIPRLLHTFNRLLYITYWTITIFSLSCVHMCMQINWTLFQRKVDIAAQLVALLPKSWLLFYPVTYVCFYNNLSQLTLTPNTFLTDSSFTQLCMFVFLTWSNNLSPN